MNRVAHVDHTVEPGGAEIALRRLLEAEHGWQGTVFVPPSAAGLGEYASLGATLAPGAVQVVQVLGVPQRAGATTASARARLAMLAAGIAQAAALRRSPAFRRSDIVHANTSRAALIGLLATVGSRRRLVVHLRDAVDAAALGSVAVRALRLALRRADGVIANSRFTLESARPWIRDGATVAVIPSPTGFDGSRPPAPPRDAVRTVGILGRLAPWKGQAQLLRAFAEAFPDGDVRLQLAGSAAFGEEAYERQLTSLAAELGIADRVDLLGQVRDIWPLLDEWDVCVHASTRPEPLGQSVLQYLAAARPTIAARAGGPLEWIDDGQTGLLTAMGDVGELAGALRRLADEPALRQQLHGNLVQQRPVRPDAEIARAHAELFAAVAGPRAQQEPPAPQTPSPSATPASGPAARALDGVGVERDESLR
ncbi:glycosyltransferase [Agrococcus beijingensis]|uniref:glycosyltransferase n=1 Tax=Agrococcus beijingensis TaxID=3068634 RepID=UPI002740C381|nr:glycosyltransferase [Agrococcus sp. REN33]